MTATILLIEDDEPIRDSLLELLTSEGYIVNPAANGAEALKTIRNGQVPHLILLDLMMPEMDGFQFRTIQLADDRIAGIPVVVMSAYGDVDKNRETLRVQAYLKKPIDIEETLDVIKRWCRG